MGAQQNWGGGTYTFGVGLQNGSQGIDITIIRDNQPFDDLL